MKKRILFSLIFVSLIIIIAFSYQLFNDDNGINTNKQGQLQIKNSSPVETKKAADTLSTQEPIEESGQILQEEEKEEENNTNLPQITENQLKEVKKNSSIKNEIELGPELLSSQNDSIKTRQNDILTHQELVLPEKESIQPQKEYIQPKESRQAIEKDIIPQKEILQVKQKDTQTQKEFLQSNKNITLPVKEIPKTKIENTKPKEEVKAKENVTQAKKYTVQPVHESIQKQEEVKETKDLIKTPSQGIDKSKQIDHHVQEKEKQAITIALFGTDESDTNDENNNKTDLIMLIKYSFQEKKAILISIPRHSMVEIPGKGISKINSTFSYGGAELAKVSLEELFNLKIDYYSKINYRGFKELVDSLGGVQINTTNKDLVNKWGYTSNEKGDIILDGATALKYVRLRKTSDGDLGRIKRQQEIFISLVKKLTRFENTFKISTLYKIASENINSDIKWREFIGLIWESRNLKQITIDYYTLKTSSQNINGINYEVINPLSLKNLSQKLSAQR